MIESVRDLSDYIGLAANLVVIVGALPVFFWLKNRYFVQKKKEISDNLEIKQSLKDKLREHADGYDRSVQHDIGIRLVYWKNYPWNLDDDGYKKYLYYDVNLDKRLPHGTEFMTNTGILVEESPWFFSESLYLGRFGTYMVTKSNRKIKGFDEVQQRLKFVHTLKYKYIINWDFEEKIEYEPVFYMKYKYTNRKLYENEFYAGNYEHDESGKNGYFREVLDTRNRIRSRRSIKYCWLILVGRIKYRKEMAIRKKIMSPRVKREKKTRRS